MKAQICPSETLKSNWKGRYEGPVIWRHSRARSEARSDYLERGWGRSLRPPLLRGKTARLKVTTWSRGILSAATAGNVSFTQWRSTHSERASARGAEAFQVAAIWPTQLPLPDFVFLNANNCSRLWSGNKASALCLQWERTLFFYLKSQNDQNMRCTSWCFPAFESLARHMLLLAEVFLPLWISLKVHLCHKTRTLTLVASWGLRRRNCVCTALPVFRRTWNIYFRAFVESV